MATSALVSTAVTGAALLVILAIVLRLRDWQHPVPSQAVGGLSGLGRAANGPLGWSIAFFVVAFGLMGLGVLYATGESAMGLDPATLGLLVLVAIVVVVTAGGLFAVYAALQSRGLNDAQAAGLTATLLASLVLLAVVVQLATA